MCRPVERVGASSGKSIVVPAFVSTRALVKVKTGQAGEMFLFFPKISDPAANFGSF
jgi:hypothetical protein